MKSDSDNKKYRILKNGVDVGVDVKTIHISDQPIDITEEDKSAIECFIETGVPIKRVTISE